jgi:hypothetical protein
LNTQTHPISNCYMYIAMSERKSHPNEHIYRIRELMAEAPAEQQSERSSKTSRTTAKVLGFRFSNTHVAVLPEKPDNQNDQQVKTFPPGFIH